MSLLHNWIEGIVRREVREVCHPSRIGPIVRETMAQEWDRMAQEPQWAVIAPKLREMARIARLMNLREAS